MKKSSKISLAVLIIIIGSLCINPIVAQTPNSTPYGYWGISVEERICYAVETDASGSLVNYSIGIYITNNTDGTVGSEYYNFLTAKIYNHTGDFWIEYPEIKLTGYNDTTYQWYGGDQVLLGMPTPAPLPFNETLVEETIYDSLVASGWSSPSSNVTGGNTFMYYDGPKSLIVVYNTTTGICVSNTLIGSIRTVLGCECPWIWPLDPPPPPIPGYPLVTLLGVFVVGVGVLIWTVVRKKKN